MIFRQKSQSTTRFSGLDVPVGDTVVVKIRDALDEAPADLSDRPIKSATCERDHFGENGPRRPVDCVWNDSYNEIMCSDFSWKVYLEI